MDRHKHCGMVILGLALWLPAAWAQQEEVPPPASPSAPASTSEETREPAEERAVPVAVRDRLPLSGVEEFMAGRRHRARSYFWPSLRLVGQADTNSYRIPASSSRVETVESVVGRLALQRVGKRHEFTTDYMGAGLIYNRRSDLNTTIHQFGFTETVMGRRWGLVLMDRVSYLPESAFGYGGFGSLGGLDSGLGGGFGLNLASLNPFFVPNQTILTVLGPRISNVAVAQLHFSPTRRTTISAAASYGILRFRESSLIDSNQRTLWTGYSHAVTPRDTLALTYGFNLFRFEGSNLGIDNHILQVAYGRRVSGRLGLGLAAGPQLQSFKNPLAGSSRRFLYNVHSSLYYRFQRSDLGVAYSRYTTAGSGLLFGAQSDLVHLTITGRLSRNWSTSLSPGYAHNSVLRQTTPGASASSYDSGYAGFSLSRALGRYMDLILNYSWQQQISRVTSPTGSRVRSTPPRHFVSVGFGWHPRRIELD